jgi:hypothetical protein
MLKGMVDKKSVTLPESYTRGEERTVESGEALLCEGEEPLGCGGRLFGVGTNIKNVSHTKNSAQHTVSLIYKRRMGL